MTIGQAQYVQQQGLKLSPRLPTSICIAKNIQDVSDKVLWSSCLLGGRLAPPDWLQQRKARYVVPATLHYVPACLRFSAQVGLNTILITERPYAHEFLKQATGMKGTKWTYLT